MREKAQRKFLPQKAKLPAKLKKITPLLFILIFGLLGAAFIFRSQAATKNDLRDRLMLYQKFSMYYRYEPVSFGVKNISTTTVNLSSSAPWKIKDERGAVVYAPIGLAVITPITPNQSINWSWNQKDSKGSYVQPGKYFIEFSGLPERALTIDTTKGSMGFFTFSVTVNKIGLRTEHFRTKLNNSTAIRAAIDGFYGKNNKFPSGLIVDDRQQGKSPYDSQWSWHLNPDSTTMVESAIEVCDGKPSDVEAALDYWLSRVKRFCPWGARVTGLE